MTIYDLEQYSLEEVFPGYLLDAQEYTSTLLKQDLFHSLLCDRVQFVYYKNYKIFTGIKSTFSNEKESIISLILIFSVAGLTLSPLKKSPNFPHK